MLKGHLAPGSQAWQAHAVTAELRAHEIAKKGADLAVLHSNVHTEEAIRGDVLIGVHHAQAPQHLGHLLMQLADAPCLAHRRLPHSQRTFQQGWREAGSKGGPCDAPSYWPCCSNTKCCYSQA